MYILETEPNFPKDPIIQHGVINLDYQGGIKIFDDLALRQKISLQVATTGIYLQYPILEGVFNKNKSTTIFIPVESIEYLNIEHNSEITEQHQQKNMVKRAAIGSVVGGRRGARLGALSALGTKKTMSKTSTYTYLLQFEGNSEKIKCTMSLELSGDGQSREVDNFNNNILKSLLQKKLVHNGDFSQLDINKKTSNEKNSDSYEELIKLKSLYDQEIITEEEFNLKKKQLLGL